MTVNQLKIHSINIGLKQYFSVIHISDSHLTLADERDTVRKRELAASRSKIFVPSAELKLK